MLHTQVPLDQLFGGLLPYYSYITVYVTVYLHLYRQETIFPIILCLLFGVSYSYLKHLRTPIGPLEMKFSALKEIMINHPTKHQTTDRRTEGLKEKFPSQ